MNGKTTRRAVMRTLDPARLALHDRIAALEAENKALRKWFADELITGTAFGDYIVNNSVWCYTPQGCIHYPTRDAAVAALNAALDAALKAKGGKA